MQTLYGSKGDEVVQMNFSAIDQGVSALQRISVPEKWGSAADDVENEHGRLPEFVKNIQVPMMRHEGDDLP